ncbi:hypothetical protein [Pseudosporangium ferrugineum]|uniref:Uncharacterized protein n=1 Tax=Pseudosporangium ferrugineum TaxID=439699 RepID=A0A2T0S7I4_9ACTN|nr:hypothetical protein [Pseudosporangium ferrugineum]PRY29355.1 hypothetical protein CLV70_10672 [Pseudosporangium ferrugineum]
MPFAASHPGGNQPGASHSPNGYPSSGGQQAGPDATMPFAASQAANHAANQAGHANHDNTMPFAASQAANHDHTMPFAAGQAGSDATMPFMAGNHAAAPPQSDPTMPFGVGASGGARQPFGGTVSHPGSPSARTSTYGSGSGQSASVPQQRGEGTVYGGLADYAPADMTMPVMMNSVENSGSLTGHILAQGWRDGPEMQRRSNVKVIVAMLVVLGLLVGVSLLFVFTVGDAFSDMIGGVFQG